MIVAGGILLAIGLALLLPRGLTGGSSLGQIAPISGPYIQRTPGYREDQGHRATWRRVGVGLALIVAGGILLAIGL